MENPRNTQKQKKSKLKLSMRGKRTIAIALALVVFVLVSFLIAQLSKKTDFEITKDILKARTYDQVQPGDDLTDSEYVTFDAFFLKDLNGDRIAEQIRGTCNTISGRDTLYMELRVVTDGYLRDGKITINGENYNLSTAIVKDNEISNNYITTDLHEIDFNNIQNGTQKLLFGVVKTSRDIIGNDTNNYSKIGSAVLTGTHVSSTGVETPINKVVNFQVDWYGTVDAGISTSSGLNTYKYSDLSTLTDSDSLNLNFTVRATENKNELILKSNHTEGTLPQLNGYDPINVRITGTGINDNNVTYDPTTRHFTIVKEATLNNNGIVTNTVNTGSSFGSRYIDYNFYVEYPIEAYESISQERTIELRIPVSTYNEGFNNPDTTLFDNPYVSNVANATIVATYEKRQGTVFDIDVTVGEYVTSPYSRYVISKAKPLRIYNGMSTSETDDNYMVRWYASTGDAGESSGLVLAESATSAATKDMDQFIKTDASSEDIKTNLGDTMAYNIGIYFTSQETMLGQDGWIKVYNDDTNDLIETFTSANWGLYNSTNPYYYTNTNGDITPIDHIRVETSATNKNASLNVYHVKQLDDAEITDKYYLEDFNELEYIKTHLVGNLGGLVTLSDTATAHYEAPISYATLNINPNVMSTQTTQENDIITISTRTGSYNEQYWVNGSFLVKFPNDIIDMKINNVTISDPNVTILGYDLTVDEDGYYWLKILTENTAEATYTITVDANITPDPRIPTKSGTATLYSSNEQAVQYYGETEDVYDVDGDLNVSEKISSYSTGISFVSPNSMLTNQSISDYDEKGSISIAPQIANIDKTQRTANIQVNLTNNYSSTTSSIKILGQIPFIGNKYIYGNTDLGSEFDTQMKNTGITLPSKLANDATVYYSVETSPTNDINLPSNHWVTANDVSDWTQIKTYLIDCGNYVFATGESAQFTYGINIPTGLDYNDVSYSSHIVYFALDTEQGKYFTFTQPAKLGLRIAKQYDLHLNKIQENTTKNLAGITFSIKEKGTNNAFIRTTDANGNIDITGLYAEKTYVIQELRTTADYVKIEDEMEFYAYVENPESENNQLVIKYKNNDDTFTDLTTQYSFVTSANTTKQAGEDWKANIQLADEVKSKLKIIKTEDQNLLKNVRFRINGRGKTNVILTTDKNGEINTSGLFLGEEYTLTEIRADGYYLIENDITFTISKANPGFTVNAQGNGLSSYSYTTSNEIPTVVLNIGDEKIPTYGLDLVKYDKDGNTLEGAQFVVKGDGLPTRGTLVTTDATGRATVPTLYEYVETVAGTPKGGIEAEYTIQEVYAPEGYTLDTTEVKIRAQRVAGSLELTVLSGEDRVRTITNPDTTTSKDEEVLNPDSNNPTVVLGFEDKDIFTLKKVDADNENAPLPGAKFKLYSLDRDGNVIDLAKDVNGEYIGEKDGQRDASKNIGFTTSGTYPWSQDANHVWYSTNQGVNSSTSEMTSEDFTLTKVGDITFKWTVSSESGYDKLYYTITNKDTNTTVNGTGTGTAISGTNYGTTAGNLTWNNVSFTLPAGTYSIKFTFTKDSSQNTGLDTGYVKDVCVPSLGDDYSVYVDEPDAIKSLNLPYGYYKLVEIEAPENYELPANEEDRTYYFGIDTSASQQVTFTDQWIDTINALDSTLAHISWNEYNDVIEDTSKNLVTVGSYSDVAYFWNNNKTDEEMIAIAAVGSRDAYIAKVDTNGLIADVGNVVGIGDSNGAGSIRLEKVIQTQDGGYVAVGTTKNYGLTVYNANGAIQNINLDTHGLEDGIIVKFNSSLQVQWVKLVGGNYEDFIYGVAQDTSGNIVVTGGANSYDVSLKGTSGDTALFSTTNANAQIYMEGFVLSVQNDGTYNWVQTLGGDSRTGNIRATGVTATNGSGIIVTACGYGTSKYITSNKGEQDGLIVAYDESGSYLWKKQVGGTQVEIMEGITNDGAGTLYAYGSYGGDSSYNSTTAQTVKVFRTDGSEEKFDDTEQSAATFTSKGSMDNIILAYQLNGLAEPDELSKTKSLSFGTNTEDEMAKLVVTDDDELIISAWAYGANLSVESNTVHTTHRGEEDAYVLKISPNTDPASNDNYQVDFFDEIAGVGMDVATSAIKTSDDGIVVAGKFGLPAADVATPLDSTKLSGQTKVLKYSNYQDGFLVKYDNYVIMPEIPQLQEITVPNHLLQYKITTEVVEHTEKDSEDHDVTTRTGGTITGQYGTFNDETYPPSEYIEFVERVKSERDSLTAIVITPDTNYSVTGIKINGVDYTNYTPDETTGVVTIPVFRALTEDKHIQVSFNRNYSNIEVNHYEWNSTNGKTTNILAASESYSGAIDSEYTTHPNTEIENYEIVTNKDIYGSNATEAQIISSINTEFDKEYTSLSDIGYSSLDEFLNDYYIPNNATGVYKEDKQVVNYYYKVKTYTLTVKHFIEGTENQVPKADGTGTVEDEVTDGYSLNDPYTTSSSNLIDSSVYRVVSDSGNTQGEILGDTTVIYYYNLKSAVDLVVHHYIVGTTNRVPSNEEGVAVVADEVLPEEGTTAVVGDPYTTNVTNKMRSDYRVATNTDVYGDNLPSGLVGTDNYVPENANGTYKDENQEVIYYYTQIDPTIDNTISKTGTTAIETEDDEVSYVITYNATIEDYIGDATISIVDTLPYTIDESASSLDGGTYNSSTKTITWRERINDIDTFTDATTGSITRTKRITVVYNNLDYELDSFTNEVKGQTILLDVDKRSEEVEDDVVTEYGFTKGAYVRKDWSDNNNSLGIRPTSVDVELKAKTVTSGTDIPEVIPSTVTTEATLNSSNNWTASWTGLKKYNSEGKLITYYFEEVEFDDNLANVYTSSTATVNAETVFNGDASDDAYVITNTYTAPTAKKNLVVTKDWLDNNNAGHKRPSSIKFVVYKSVPGTPATIDRTTPYAQYTLDTATETSHTFAVDLYDIYGYEINYEVEEEEVNNGDLKFYTTTGGEVTDNAYGTEYVSTIKNTFNVPEEEVRIKINKVWDDNSNYDNQRPSQVKFIINKLVAGVETKVTEYTLTVSADSEEITIPGLVKYDQNGDEIVYTVREEEVNTDDLKYYSATSTNLVETSEVDPTSGETITILSTTMTNKFEPELFMININVKKIWSDNNDQYGKRPDSVTFNLKNGNTVVGYKVLNATNNWSDEFTNIAKYDDQDREIVYTIEEVETNPDDLKFYTKGNPTGNVANGFEITNTFNVPDDKIQIPVTKTWTDNSNETNDRPSSIIFKLTGNNQEYTHELTSANNQSPTDANSWTYTFENLPKYDATGTEIVYTLSEQAATVGDLANYKEEKTSDYVINNTLLLKDIDVTKNGTYRISSFDDVIDYSIKYRAKIDKDYNQDVTLTLVDNLPYNIDTTKTYHLDGGVYDDTAKTITWTGTYNFTTNKITWSDNTTTNVGNTETTASGEAFIVNDGTDNTIGFNKDISFVYKDLPLSISKITNSTTGTVQLVTGNPMTDTDTHDTGVFFKTEVKVRKVWQGDSDSIAARPAVTLYVNTETANGTLTPVAQATITSSYVDPQDENVWVYTFEDLPKYDSTTREEINYIVTEDPVPAGYYLEYDKDDEGRQLVINSKTGSIAISNTITKTGTATINEESDAINYSIAYNATITDYVGTATVTIVDTLPYTIDVANSDINGGTYNADNKTITWTQNVAGINTFNDATTGNIAINKQLTLAYNDVNFGLDSFTNTVRGQTLLNKTNISSEEVTDTAVTEYGFTKNITATKTWTGKTNDIAIFNLRAYTLNGGVETEETIPDTVQTRAVVTANDNWTKNWTGLNKYNAQGKLIYYDVTEEVPTNFTMSKTETSSGNNVTFTFNNTYDPQDKQITVQKIWDDNNNANNKRPQVIGLVVYKLDTNGNVDRSTVIAEGTLNVATENSYTFNVQKFKDSGDEIFYTVEEREITAGDLEFYENTIATAGNQTRITNRFKVPDDKVKIVVNKVWNDSSNENNERPTNITFTVSKLVAPNLVTVDTKEVTVSRDDTQTVEFTGLDKYDENGNEIVYIVSENQINYYTTTVSAYTESSEVDATTNKEVKVLTSTVTNTFDPNSVKMDIEAEKIWNDENNRRNKRPSSLILKLMNETTNTEVERQVANSQNNWKVTFNNIPKYDTTGNAYQYTVEEVEAQTDDLKFYTTGTTTGDAENGFEITNTFTVPDEKVNILTKKAWNDNSNQSNERPESVIFILTGNNQEYTHELNVNNVDASNADNWTYTFENLPKYNEDGDEIEYVLSEQAVTLGDLANYKKEKTGDYVITNSLILKEIDVEKDGTTAISSLDDTVTYNLQYKTKLDNQYQDTATLTMIDTLPYAIDTEKPYDLAGGVYDSANRTITWTGELDYTTNKITWNDGRTTNLLNEETTESGKAYLVTEGNDNIIGFNKTITIVYKDLPLSTTTLTNNVLGRVELLTGATKEDRDVYDTTVNFVVDVRVKKKWQGDNDSTDGRTNVVLAVNAKAEDGTLTKVSEATLSDGIIDPDDTNSWIYVFNGLPKYDTTTRKEVEYVVTEEDVPTGYFVTYETENDGTLVAINSKLGSITLTKVDKIDDTIKIGGAEFKIEKLKKDGNNWIVDNSFVSQTATSSTEQSTLGQFKFTDLEYGKYRITETKASDGYNLAMSPIEVEIDVDNKDYVGNFADIKSAILPEAGGKIAIYSVVVVAIIAAGIVIYKKKFADNK